MFASYRYTRLLIMLVIVLLSGQFDAKAQNGDQMVRRLKQKYDSIKSLKADFTQSLTSSFDDQAQSIKGTLLLQGPRYRVDTGLQTVVTDGKTTWIYNSSDNQVLVNDAVQDESSFSISDFFANFDKRYTAGKAETVTEKGEKHYKVRLTPRNKNSFFREVTFWLRDRDNLVSRLEVFDINDTRMTFHLSNIQVNPPVPANTFTFSPPKNAEVVDLRS